MNIFALSDNAFEAAKSQCDKHVVKMIVETAQILSTVAYFRGVISKDFYTPTHIHHPCVKWASESQENYLWLSVHGISLSLQYTTRYKRMHKTESVIQKLDLAGKRIWGDTYHYANITQHTPFVQCMPEQYRGSDAVEAYRRFYKGEKSRFAKWKYTSPPEWWNSDELRVEIPKTSVIHSTET